MTTLIDKIKPDLLEMLNKGWVISVYDAHYDDGEKGFVAIAHDIPDIFEESIQGIGTTPEKALKQLIENIKSDSEDDSDLELE